MLTLPRRVGVARARELMTSGKVSGGRYCHEIGLADEYVDDDNVMSAAINKAIAMAELPQSAFGRFKNRLNHPSANLDEELLREENDQAVLLLAAEFEQGYNAARQKRPANFSTIKREERHD